MGSKKMELRGQIDKAEQQGGEIREGGEQKVEEVEISAQALESTETVDDDDKAAVDAARSEAEGISKMVAESDIRAPGQEVGEQLHETAAEARESGDITLQGAETAGEMTGDYSDTGSNLGSQLEASGEEFHEIGEESDQVDAEMQAELERLAAQVESTF